MESQIVFLDLHDRLEVYDREEGGSLAVSFHEDHGIEGSLAVCKNHSLARAARALAAALGKSIEDLEMSWNIIVRKAIPAGAGLGGGSSDAASFLREARKKLDRRGVSLSDAEWLSVAREVGSDVALFFLRSCSNRVFVSGFGERVAEQESLPLCGVVLLCGAGLSTSEVYDRYARDRAEGRASMMEESCLSASKSSRLRVLLEGGGNDLLSAACALDASIVERLSALRSCEEVFCARMTGSGSACFGLTALGCEEGVASRLRASGWRGVIATRFLSCEEGEEVDKAREEV